MLLKNTLSEIKYYKISIFFTLVTPYSGLNVLISDLNPKRRKYENGKRKNASR